MANGVLTPTQLSDLRQALASGSRLGASDLRLINIDVYRERLGSNWPKYRDIIRAYAAAAIEMELEKDDFFVETKLGYGIFFFKKGLSEIRQISSRIETKLRRQLAGDPTFGDPPLGCSLVSVDCEEFLRQLETETRSTRTAGLLPATSRASPPAVTALSKTADNTYAALWSKKLERIVGSILVQDIPSVKPRLPDLQYYKPSALRLQDDKSRFNSMLADAYKLHKAGQNTTIVFSLNFLTFCEPAFAKEYMQVLRQSPNSLLKYLTPRFVRIPPNTSQSLIASRVQTLMTCFHRVIAQTRPPVCTRPWEFVPLSMLAMSWRDAVHCFGNDPSTLGDAMKGFCQTARLLRANSLITGIDSPFAFEIAMRADANFISGKAILPNQQTPCHQQAYSVATIRAGHDQVLDNRS